MLRCAACSVSAPWAFCRKLALKRAEMLSLLPTVERVSASKTPILSIPFHRNDSKCFSRLSHIFKILIWMPIYWRQRIFSETLLEVLKWRPSEGKLESACRSSFGSKTRQQTHTFLVKNQHFLAFSVKTLDLHRIWEENWEIHNIWMIKSNFL